MQGLNQLHYNSIKIRHSEFVILYYTQHSSRAVPVDILHHPPAYIPIDGNPPLTLTVAFSGRQAQNMSITWHRNGIPLANSIINTTYRYVCR